VSTAKAQKRLQSAFDRLEAAARRLKDRGHEEGSVTDALEKARGELAEMRKNYEALEHKTTEASGRIDAAVVRLKAIIDA
jgi:predicted  nucleic acid-binding Zn-ribbon protein